MGPSYNACQNKTLAHVLQADSPGRLAMRTVLMAGH